MATPTLLQQLLVLSRESRKKKEWTSVGQASQLRLYRRRPTKPRGTTKRHFRLEGDCVGQPLDALNAIRSPHHDIVQSLIAFTTNRRMEASIVDTQTRNGVRRVHLAPTKCLFQRCQRAAEEWIIQYGTAPVAIETAVHYVIMERVNKAVVGDINGESTEQPCWVGFLLREVAPGLVRVFGAGEELRISASGAFFPQAIVRLLQFGEAMHLQAAVAQSQLTRWPPNQPSRPSRLHICTICHVEPSRHWWSWTPDLKSCDVCHHQVCTSCLTDTRLLAVKVEACPFVWATCCKTCLVTLRGSLPLLHPPRLSAHTATSWFRPDEYDQEHFEDVDLCGPWHQRSSAETMSTDSNWSSLHRDAGDNSQEDADEAIPMLEESEADLHLEDLAQ